MKKELLLVLFCMIIMSAKCDNADVAKYFKRPIFRQCITLEAAGLMACNGVVKPIPPSLIISEDFEAEDEAFSYYADKEERLFFCLTNRRKFCQ